MSRPAGLTSRRRTRTTVALALIVVLGGVAAYSAQSGPAAGQVAPPAADVPRRDAVQSNGPRASSAAPAHRTGGGMRAEHRSVSIPLRGSHERGRLFRIGGTPSARLAPGLSVPVNLRLSNPHAFPVSVRRLTVRVRSIRAPRADARHPCTVRDFAITQFSGRRFGLRPERSARLRRLGLRQARWPRVSMLDRPVNQDGCKGASLTLGYSGAGRR